MSLCLRSGARVPLMRRFSIQMVCEVGLLRILVTPIMEALQKMDERSRCSEVNLRVFLHELQRGFQYLAPNTRSGPGVGELCRPLLKIIGRRPSLRLNLGAFQR